LVEGPAGRVGVVDLVLVSAIGATEAAGLELAAGTGELVCAFTAVRAKNAAPAQRKMLRRLGIDDVRLKNASGIIAGSRPALGREFATGLKQRAGIKPPVRQQ
jgi:hypothetical protein